MYLVVSKLLIEKTVIGIVNIIYRIEGVKNSYDNSVSMYEL